MRGDFFSVVNPAAEAGAASEAVDIMAEVTSGMTAEALTVKLPATEMVRSASRRSIGLAAARSPRESQT